MAFGSKVVEYALSLPGGRLLPIDSKWTSAAAVERLAEAEDPLERRRLAEQVEGRMSRSLVQLQNARDALRDELAEARRSTSRLLEAAVPEPALLSIGPAGAGEPD